MRVHISTQRVITEHAGVGARAKDNERRRRHTATSEHLAGIIQSSIDR